MGKGETYKISIAEVATEDLSLVSFPQTLFIFGN